ncbi:MAG: hypothetical protein ACRC63_02130, partial [Metamycoplasmataceae bacterium]
APILLPLTIVSCSQNSNQDRINEAREKIKQIVADKPKPTLLNQPSDTINLENYLQIGAFVAPTTEFTGVIIELYSVELPSPNSTNLVIWLKVTSTNTLDIIAEISDFYSVNFNEINGINPDRIQEIEIDQLTVPFTNLINSRNFALQKLVEDAINGSGFFSNLSKLDPDDLNNDSSDLDDRLTTNNINENIFENQQRNIYAIFIRYDLGVRRISLSFELQNEDNTANVSVNRQFEISQIEDNN